MIGKRVRVVSWKAREDFDLRLTSWTKGIVEKKSKDGYQVYFPSLNKRGTFKRRYLKIVKEKKLKKKIETSTKKE